MIDVDLSVDPNLKLTEAQMRGYRACFHNTGDHYLCFLVPNEWKHIASIDQVQAILPSTISIHTANWRDLIKKLEQVSHSLEDAITDEAIKFWKWKFQGEQMTLQERNSLNSWSVEQYSAIRKLEKTINRAKALFDVRNLDVATEVEGSDIEGYGFYLKRGRSYILWVGIWTKSPTPLSFGFHSVKSNWLRPSPLPLADSTAHDHYLWSLGSETWDDPEELYATVNSFLHAYLIESDQGL